jgi:hypothetical protein
LAAIGWMTNSRDEEVKVVRAKSAGMREGDADLS